MKVQRRFALTSGRITPESVARLTGICIALCFLLNTYIPFIFLAFLFYLWLLFKYPEVALFASILAIFNCFSMMSEDFLRFPYLFRIRDIFFLSTFFPLLWGIYKRDKKAKYAFSNSIAKGIYLILFLCFIQVFVTKLRFPEESFNSIVRMGRRYFYYAIFFFVLYILLDKQRLRRFMKLCVGGVIIFCFMYIIQFLIGPAHRIFLWGRVEYQILQGFKITRMYILGAVVVALTFHISFMLFLFHNKFKYRFKNIFLMMLSGVQTLVTFGRAHIFGVVTGTLFGIACAKRQMKFRNLFKILIVFLLIFVFAEVTSKVLFPHKEALFKAISSRVASTWTAVIRQEDTFYFRIKDSLGRMELIKKNPILGIGFVHDESKLFAFERGFSGNLRTTDSGTATLLLDFGILGFLWLFAMSLIVLRRGLSIYNRADSQFYKSAILGIIAFYFGRLFSFITLADFVVYDGIVVIALSLVGVELVNYHILKANS